MSFSHKRYLAILALLLVLSLVISACGSSDTASGELPPIAPTDTARPHATATFIAPQERAELPEIDWNDVDHMYAAMRPEYTQYVDDAVNRNRYYIEASLEITPVGVIINGSQRVRFTNRWDEPIPDIVFRLYPNLADNGGEIRVRNFRLEGELIEPELTVRNSILRIPLEEPLLPTRSVEMSMDFIMVLERGVNPEGYGFDHDQMQAVNWHPTLSVYEGPDEGWWDTRIDLRNLDNYYSDVGLQEVLMTHDENLVFAISGKSIETQENGDGTVTERIVTGPIRDSFILAGTTMGVITDEIDGTTVNVYFLPEGERGAEWGVQASLQTLEVFNEIYGDYPYAEVDIGESYIGAGGIEYSGIVVIAQNLWQNGNPTMELVIAHELAHQWWYGMVGNNQGYELFVDESLTSYSEGVYLRNAYDDNEENFNQWIQAARQQLNTFLGLGGQNLTMFRAGSDFPPNHVGAMIYTKGRVFYNELENMIGRDAFESAVANYFEDMKFKFSSPYDLMRHFEATSGQDLDAFFYEWVGEFDGLDPAVLDTAAEIPFDATLSQDTYSPPEDRLTYFNDAMRSGFQEDVLVAPDAPLYTMDVALTATNNQASISGTLFVEYTNQTPDTLNEIVFRLYPNLSSYGGRMTVSNVMVDDQSITPALDNTSSVMTIPLSTPSSPGDTILIQMDFVTIIFAERVNLYAQFSYLNGALALPNFFPLLSVYDADAGWSQNADHSTGDAVYSETAFFDVTLTAPLEWITITSGTRVDSVENEDGETSTAHYIAPLMRDFALMAYSDYETLTNTVDGITVNVHYLPTGLDNASSVLTFASDAVEIYNSLFGPYPFAELDIVETYTTAGGIEYPGLIVIQNDMWDTNDSSLQFVTVHEVAHQWWYSLVGNDQTQSPWLDESLTQYSTALYFGRKYGATSQNATMTNFETEWQSYIDEFDDQPIGEPAANYVISNGTYYYIVYQKGPVFFATLADMVGEDNLIAALADYYAALRYQVAQPIDLQNILEQSLQQDLDAFFNEWVGEIDSSDLSPSDEDVPLDNSETDSEQQTQIIG